MDWLAKMIGLPNDFLHSNADTTGGGVIQVRQEKNVFGIIGMKLF
jgi:histidine decarboxylase